MVTRGIKTGEDFEQAMLGISHEYARRSIRPYAGERDFDSCVHHAKVMQGQLGWNPKKPKTPFSRRFFSSVAGSLKNLPHKYLRMFVAVGTPLDSRYGVDLFFEYEGAIVTVDLTISERKEDPQADVVLTLADLEENLHYAISYRISSLLESRVRAISAGI